MLQINLAPLLNLADEKTLFTGEIKTDTSTIVKVGWNIRFIHKDSNKLLGKKCLYVYKTSLILKIVVLTFSDFVKGPLVGIQHWELGFSKNLYKVTLWALSHGNANDSFYWFILCFNFHWLLTYSFFLTGFMSMLCLIFQYTTLSKNWVKISLQHWAYHVKILILGNVCPRNVD